MGAALAGHPSHTRVWTLSDDGTYMTETIVGHIDGKTPHIRPAIWTAGEARLIRAPASAAAARRPPARRAGACSARSPSRRNTR